VDKWHHSEHGTKIIKFLLQGTADNRPHEPWYFMEEESAQGDNPPTAWFYRCCTIRTGTGEFVESIQRDRRFAVVDGVAVGSPCAESALAPGVQREARWSYFGRHPISPRFKYREPSLDRLFAELESGAVFQVHHYTFSKE
jgi:hypothetical protein